MKRSILYSLTLALLLLGATAVQADYTYLNFVATDGNETSVTAAGVKITFSNGQARVEVDAEVQTFSLAELSEMYFTNTLTGLNSVVTTSESNATYYDLQGRAVGNPTKGGIYIHNGKKVVK